MTITKRGFICLAACMLAASLFARHHHHLPPNAYWCHKCDGDGYNWTWYGWKKTCGICDGRGWLVKHMPPPPAVHHGGQHHGGPAIAPKPAPKPAPRPAAKPAPKPAAKPAPKPAAKPAPGGKTPPKAPPRR